MWIIFYFSSQGEGVTDTSLELLAVVGLFTNEPDYGLDVRRQMLVRVLFGCQVAVC